MDQSEACGEPTTGENDRLADVVRTVIHAADSAFLDSGRGTTAMAMRSAVWAAFECALGNGLIQITDPETWPTYLSIDPPYDPKAGLAALRHGQPGSQGTSVAAPDKISDTRHGQ